ncbi:sigma-70 family RNA polymerase sigma factor [Oharaeibacter diazotrophicus]|uniref:RNA polymerase sigma factor n=1 Tax=Oharaeibacter diazotrophicus TaxID=1920512 RepID=A0A4R6RKW2_9HYPH|nr:sigma-70 family RNA polymerase sigma factor [Oharaeibacter diazotrophicus]TDP87253.1 RNA polymerase sigma-70 factor (ECF subfamily) [Oharaeibacter diazotrophicus]BBE70804.1 FecI-family sigma factor [Pleomorphomonas sp. SM30]GLS77552.1 RNA polymerase sigma factor [Oharaeibacter diazotrophicus]
MSVLQLSHPSRPARSGGVLGFLVALTVRALDIRGRAAPARPTAAGADRSDARLEAFERTVLPHLDAAHDLARYLCRDAVAAEDVAQEAVIRAFRAFDGWRGVNARAWLLAIVRNCHFDWRAHNRAAGVVFDPAPLDEEAVDVAAPDDPEATLLRRDEATAVRRTLEALPLRQREVLVLRDVEDLSYREIAEVLAVPIGTVMSRLARARAAFQVLWAGARPKREV